MITTLHVRATTADGERVQGTLTGNGAGKYTGLKTDDGLLVAVRKSSVVPSRSVFDAIGADRLAYHCGRAIQSKHLDSRSPVGDALLDYLHVDDIPRWLENYRKNNN